MADKVTQFLQTLCQMERFGGRCTRIDHGTWEIVDISRWTEEQNLKLRSQFPSIEATIIANDDAIFFAYTNSLFAHKMHSCILGKDGPLQTGRTPPFIAQTFSFVSQCAQILSAPARVTVLY